MDTKVAEKVKKFFEQYQARRYLKGQILIHAQDNPTAVYYITAGRVKKYDVSYRGDEVVLNVFGPPAFFPMSYAINKTPNQYFYEAETDVELHVAPIKETLTFLKCEPDVVYDLLSRVYRGTDGLLGRMAHMMAASAKSRVMYELLIEGRRMGQERDGAVAVLLNEGDIAARSGLARETVSREMQKLKKDGLIALTGQEIVIKDFKRLTESISLEL